MGFLCIEEKSKIGCVSVLYVVRWMFKCIYE